MPLSQSPHTPPSHAALNYATPRYATLTQALQPSSFRPAGVRGSRGYFPDAVTSSSRPVWRRWSPVPAKKVSMLGTNFRLQANYVFLSPSQTASFFFFMARFCLSTTIFFFPWRSQLFSTYLVIVIVRRLCTLKFTPQSLHIMI